MCVCVCVCGRTEGAGNRRRTLVGVADVKEVIDASVRKVFGDEQAVFIMYAGPEALKDLPCAQDAQECDLVENLLHSKGKEGRNAL